MNKFIEELKKRNIVYGLQKAADIIGIQDEMADEAVETALRDRLNDDTELCDLFLEEATEFALKTVVKELHIRADKEHRNSIKERIQLMKAIFRK